MKRRMYYLPKGTSAETPTAEDLENAVDLTEAFVSQDVSWQPTLANRAERRACAKAGHQAKAGYCAYCGVEL